MYKYKIPYPKFNDSNVSNKLKNIQTKIGTKIGEIKKPELTWTTIVAIIIIIILMLLIAYFLYYLLTDCYQKKSLAQYIFDFSFDPCVYKYAPTTYKERKLEREKEVFHIANQDYTYEQAKCKCAAYGGRLATKSEIIDAYNKGADWCTYGWSEGQTAYYPTQKCTWDKLQEGDVHHRLDCGWPGVNGGFFANPKLKFGINCYGIKPKGKLVKEKAPICEGKDFCQMNVNYAAAHKLDTDEISPFNEKQWSLYG